MKSDPTFWIAARATGFTAYSMVTISVLAGLILKSRPFGNRLKPATVTDLHRFLALLALGAVGIHGTVLVYDDVVPIDWRDLFVPGGIPYRTVWTSVGVVAAELMFVIYVSFSLRRFIGVRNWRRLHWATYLVFAGVTTHGLMAGSDSHQQWAIYLYVSAVGLVVAATVFRAIVPPVGAPGRASARARAQTEAFEA